MAFRWWAFSVVLFALYVGASLSVIDSLRIERDQARDLRVVVESQRDIALDVLELEIEVSDDCLDMLSAVLGVR